MVPHVGTIDILALQGLGWQHHDLVFHLCSALLASQLKQPWSTGDVLYEREVPNSSIATARCLLQAPCNHQLASAGSSVVILRMQAAASSCSSILPMLSKHRNCASYSCARPLLSPQCIRQQPAHSPAKASDILSHLTHSSGRSRHCCCAATAASTSSNSRSKYASCHQRTTSADQRQVFIETQKKCLTR